jgi:hypothetical protein
MNYLPRVYYIFVGHVSKIKKNSEFIIGIARELCAMFFVYRYHHAAPRDRQPTANVFLKTKITTIFNT